MMKKGYALLTVLVAVLLVFSGCSKYPAEELAKAEQAVQEAKAAGAHVNAPEDFAAAEAKLAEAKYAADVEKDYEKARKLANEAVMLANAAKGKIPPPPPPPPPPPEPEPVAEPGVVYFDFDRYNIRPDAAQTLKENAPMLEGAWTLQGHCDERGTAEYNMALGDRRAKAVKNYLVSLGVKGSDLSTVSFGKSQPANPGHTEAAYSENRRVEFSK